MAEPIKVTEKAYELASAIGASGADKKYIDLKVEWRGPELSELIQKKVAKREGHGKGQYGDLGTVKLLVPLAGLVKAATRARKPKATPAASNGTTTTGTLRPADILQLGALERFVADFKERVELLMGTRRKEADERVAAAKKAVTTAKDEQAEKAASRELHDALEARTRLASSVEVEVARSLSKADFSNSLEPVVRAMQGR